MHGLDMCYDHGVLVANVSAPEDGVYRGAVPGVDRESEEAAERRAWRLKHKFF